MWADPLDRPQARGDHLVQLATGLRPSMLETFLGVWVLGFGSSAWHITGVK